MYLLDQTGTKLFKTEDCSDIMIVSGWKMQGKNFLPWWKQSERA